MAHSAVWWLNVDLVFLSGKTRFQTTVSNWSHQMISFEESERQKNAQQQQQRTTAHTYN